MNTPSNLKYTKNDEWIKMDGDTGTVGITDHAQDQLSDIVFVEIIVSVGDDVHQGDSCATVESVKAAADVYMPVSGKIVAVNEELANAPETINKDPYGAAWMVKVQPESKVRGYKPGRFSFNVHGGRCEACQGQGQLRIEMQFLPDVYVPCDVCHGARFNRETLQVRFKDLDISQVLDLTVDEALEVFSAFPGMLSKLQVLQDVGLGYIRVGQPAPTLSGGEAQRVKLARELSRRATGRTLYVLDEPSVGLHAADVHKQVEVLQRLVDAGNSVIVIEHNLDIIKTADYIIDLGPEGGFRGGQIIAQGTPEEICKVEASHTGRYLKSMLERR
jgi:excinuclease ABC subunit A